MNSSRVSKFSVLALAGILFVAMFFRFYKLATNPPSLNWDEVAFGYNAYSILKTGKDEFGNAFPLYFRSLDDYKLPVYVYLTAGSIAIFGYNDFAVRFASAFAGILTVCIVGFIAYRLTSSKRIGLLSSGVIAILPWNIQFSRMAAEANVGLMFLCLGAAAFLYGLGKRRWLMIVSLAAFILAMYSYLSFRVVAPLLGLTLVILYWKDLMHLSNRYKIGLCTIVGAFIIFILWDTVSHNVHIRVKATNVLLSEYAYNIFQKKEKEMYVDAKKNINIPRRIFHDSKLFTTLDIYTRGYITHFSPTFFFFDYDEKQHHTPFAGLCYIWMLPFFLLGLYFFTQKVKRRERILLFLWLLISPLPASVTLDVPHAIRAYGMVVPITISTASGILFAYDYLLHRKGKILFTAGLFAVVVISLYYYFHQYMVHLPIERSHDWVYGRREMTDYIEKNKWKYDRIVISSALKWPYIFTLYYSKYDPKKYLEQGGTVSGGWAEENNHYDKYEFHRFQKEDLHGKKTLFAGTPDEFSEKVDPLRTIYYLDGTPAIYVLEGDIITR